MTGDLVKAMRACPQPIDRRDRRRLRRRRRDRRDGLRPALRHAAQPRSRSCSSASAWPAATWAPARCCRASSARAAPSELLYTGRSMSAEEGRALGLLQPAVSRRRVLGRGACDGRRRSPPARRFAHAMTKKMLHQEWNMGIDEAIEAEAQAQAICMQTEGFPPRLPAPSWRSRSRCSRATDGAMDRFAHLRLAVLRRPRTAAAGARGSTPGRPRNLGDEPRRGCRRRSAQRLVQDLGCARLAAPQRAARPKLDVRSICAAPRDARLPFRPRRFRVRDAGPRHRPDRAVRQRLRRSSATCRKVGRGDAIAAFALSEPEAGSDVAAMSTHAHGATATTTSSTARRPGSRTAASPHFYVVFAAGEGRRTGISAFVVDADTPGSTIAERIDVIAPHPLAHADASRTAACRDAAVGEPGQGFKVAMRDARHLPHDGRRRRARLRAPRARRGAWRVPSGARCSARRSPTSSSRRPSSPRWRPTIDAAALLIYRAAWTRDAKGARVTREAAMAKLFATEAAQQVIDDAVQMFGGLGVVSGRAGGAAVPRDPRAAHLRRRERGAEADHRRQDAAVE